MCGPAPTGWGAPNTRVVGSTERIVSSVSLTTSSGLVGPFGGGAAMTSGGLPTSMVPDSVDAFRLAIATAWADGEPSAAMTVSEFGAAPTARGARSRGTVAATAAAPIGTTDSVWSSRLAVTAYSPANGSGACRPKACWRGSGVGAGPPGATAVDWAVAAAPLEGAAAVASAVAAADGVAAGADAGCGPAAGLPQAAASAMAATRAMAIHR